MSVFRETLRAKNGARALRSLILLLAAAFLSLSLLDATRVSDPGNPGKEPAQTFARSCNAKGGEEHKPSHNLGLCCLICYGQADHRSPLLGASAPLSEIFGPLREVALSPPNMEAIAPPRAWVGSGGAWSSRAPPFVS